MKIDVHTHFLAGHIARTLEKRSDFPYTRLVDGTDHPYGFWQRPIELVAQLGCSDDEREQIGHGNVERLFAA